MASMDNARAKASLTLVTSVVDKVDNVSLLCWLVYL